jgi:hypothetical protein
VSATVPFLAGSDMQRFALNSPGEEDTAAYERWSSPTGEDAAAHEHPNSPREEGAAAHEHPNSPREEGAADLMHCGRRHESPWAGRRNRSSRS